MSQDTLPLTLYVCVFTYVIVGAHMPHMCMQDRGQPQVSIFIFYLESMSLVQSSNIFAFSSYLTQNNWNYRYMNTVETGITWLLGFKHEISCYMVIALGAEPSPYGI